MTLPIWTFAPDWNREVRVTYSFLSEIITSREGREQRIAQRNTPRLNYEFSVLLEGYDYRSLLAQMSSSQWASLLMPDWSRPVFLRRDHTAGETILRLEAPDTWLSDGVDAVLIWDNAGAIDHLLVSVTDAASSSATISVALPRAVPKGAALHFMRQGHLSQSLKGTMQTDRLVTMTVSFNVDPGFEELTTAPSAPLTYSGRELFLIEPNWTRPPSIELLSSLETLDYGRGRMGFFSPVPFQDRVMGAEFLGVNRTEIDEIVDFFRRQKGQQGEFYMPTYTEDLRLRSNGASGASVLRVVGSDVALHFADSLVYKHIVIFFDDGTKEIYGVTSIDTISDATGQDSRLHLSSPLGQAVTVGNVDMICWLPLCRLMSDDLVVQWVSDEVANIGVTIKTLEHLPAEV